MKVASDVLTVELLQKDARLAAIGELGKACPGGTMELISTTSLKVVDIQRRCLPQQHLRRPTFKDGVEHRPSKLTFKDGAFLSTVFESCSPTKTVILDPSLKFLTFNDVTFYDR
ncbi:Phosphoenolpyruvate carboxylase 4 [Glycine soja]